MKKIRRAITAYLLHLDTHWQKLTTRQQQRRIIYAFTAYLLATAWVIGKVWLDTGTSRHALPVRHIENPVLLNKTGPKSKVDSLLKTLKTITYGKQK